MGENRPIPAVLVARMPSPKSQKEPAQAATVRASRQWLSRHAAAVPAMADFYRLLANPTRLRILLTLGRVERLCVGDLAAVVGLSAAATSQQLKMLKGEGWLRAEGHGKQVYYSITSNALRDALEGDLDLLRKKPRG